MPAFPCFVNSTKAPQKPHAEQSVRGSAWKARGLEGERSSCRWPLAGLPRAWELLQVSPEMSAGPVWLRDLSPPRSQTLGHRGRPHPECGLSARRALGGGERSRAWSQPSADPPGADLVGPSLQRSRTRPRTERDQVGTGAGSGASAPSRGLCLGSSRASLFCSHGQHGSKARS